MSGKQGKPILTIQHIAAIESILAKGERVELVPGPNDSIKILRVRRNVVKMGPQRPTEN